MSTGSNAVTDLVRQASTRRLETDPGDSMLFQSRDESRGGWPRGTVNWTPPAPEPVTPVKRPNAPGKKRAWWKLGALAIAAVAGVAAAMIGFKDAKDLAPPHSISQSPPTVAVLVPASQPQPQPQPEPAVAAPAVAPVPPAAEPTIASTPTSVETPAAEAPTAEPPAAEPPTAEPKPKKPAAITKSKRRVHAEMKHAAKPRHVATATTTTITKTTKTTKTTTPPPTAAAPERHAGGQARDNENPL